MEMTMTMNPLDFFQAMEGRGLDGQPKAIVALQNETLHQGQKEPHVHAEVTTTSAVAEFAINNRKLVVSLTWDSFDDMEYLRFAGFFKQYAKDTRPSHAGAPHLAVLTISDACDYEYFITAVIGTYAKDGDKPCIRFLIDADDASLYRLNENELATQADEVAALLDAAGDD